MRWQREAGTRCGQIYRGVVVQCQFGMWGTWGGLGWLSRAVERVQGVQGSDFLEKDQREGVGRAAARFS
jgi:hypothetical protein